MSAPAAPCLACEIAAGRHRPPGGVVARWPGFVLHGVAGPTPVPGWLVLAPERHVRGFYDLDEDEASRLAALARRVALAQRGALGVEHVYAVALGEVLRHAHLHLIPRPAGLPERLQGARVFQAEPSDHCPPDAVEAAALSVARALGAP